jgi:hypothetical protein
MKRLDNSVARNYTATAIICRVVLILPNLFTCKVSFLTSLEKYSLRELKINSLEIIINTGNNIKELSNKVINHIKQDVINNLSATRSNIAPSLEVDSNFLAIYPSKKSVRLAVKNKQLAIYPEYLNSKELTDKITGINAIRMQDNIFGT